MAEQENGQKLNMAQRAASEVKQQATKKATEAAKKKMMSKFSKTAVKKASLSGPMMLLMLKILVVILIIIAIIGIVMFLVTMPGMVMDKIKALGRVIGDAIASWFGGNDAEIAVTDEKIYEILDYLEQMGYDLQGEGFLTDIYDETDVDNPTEQKVENGMIRNKEEGTIEKAESLFIYNYLISDNYVYTVKNFNLSTGNSWWSPFAAIGARLLNFFAGDNIAEALWGEGLIAIYHELNGQIGVRGDFYGNGIFHWNDIDVDPEARTLSIRRGWGSNKMVYSLDGWTGRYGMPLEFLLSVQLATKMPDLAYDMTKAFGDTEIEILLHPLEGVNAETAYEKDFTGGDTANAKYITYAEMKNIKGEGWSPTDGWALSGEEAFNIMKLGVKSPEGCTFTSPTYKIETATDNGDGWIFDANHYSTLTTSYGGTYSELDELGEDLAKISIEAQAEDFKVSETMVSTTNESAEYTPSKLTEATGFGYSSSIAQIETETSEVSGKELLSGCSCTATSHSSQEGYMLCPTHSTYGGRGITVAAYCPPNTFYEIERTITNRYWNADYNGEETEYTWVTYRYRVYKYSDSARTQGKTYVTSYFIDYILRNKTTDELIADGVLNEDGTPKNTTVCSDAAQNGSTDITECCETCRKYIKKIMKLMKEGNDPDFDTYTPYISKVTNHWYRDVYFVLSASEVNSKEFVQVDQEYEALMGERWTLYETDDQGQYVLYEVNADGSLGNQFQGTQADANEQGKKVAKKPITIKITDTDEDGDQLISWEEGSFGTWSAYKESDQTTTSAWEKLYADSEDEAEQKIYVRITSQDDIVQVEEGQRTATNDEIKKLFLNNRYFKYDGSQETADIIYELRNSMSSGSDLKMGALTDSELEKTVTIDGETYSAKDYSGTVELTQNSLSAFSMLENTHTVDADYIYRDFKELVVELGYFTKEELTDETPRIFQWLIPEIGSAGYPISSLDKKENEYGTLAHSKEDYEANEKNTLAAKYAEAEAKRAIGETGDQDVGNGAIVDGVSGMDVSGNANVNNQVSSIKAHQTTASIEEIVGAMGSDIERRVEEGDGYEYKVTVNGVEYTHYYQAQGSYKDNPFWDGTIASDGCGPTSCCNILTGYGENITPADTAGFLKTLSSNADLVKVLDNWGLGSQWIDGKSDAEYKSLMEEAFNEGKPVIILMSAAKGGDDFWTTKGHFVAVVGVDNQGNMITIDPGSSKPERHTYTPGIDGAVKYMTGILIPDEAPTGAKKGGLYEGYEGGEAVVSPVTGILLEYGTYDDTIDPLTGEESRINVDLKYEQSEGEENPENEGNPEVREEPVIDKVGYAKILVLDDETYLEIENQMRSSGADALSAMAGNSLMDADGNYLENKEMKKKDILDEWSDEAKTLYGYKEFAELYSDFDVSGNIIYIDGFKCELPAEKTETSEDDESESQNLGSGVELSLDYFKSHVSDYEHTLYEKEERYNLSSQDATNKLNNENDVKDFAVPLMMVGDKLVIKEGTVIGRTMSNEEVVTARGDVYEPPAEETEDGEENTSKVQGNYLRIIMRDLDDTVVENVELYMKLDEDGARTDSDWELFFWLPFESGGTDVEGCGPESQGTCSGGETAVGIIQWTVLARDYHDDDDDPNTPPDQDNGSKGDMNNIANQFIKGCLEENSALCAPLAAYQSWTAEQFWLDYKGSKQFQATLKQICSSNRDEFLQVQMEVAKKQYLEPLLEDYPWLESRPSCVQGAVMHLRVWGAGTDWMSSYQSASDEDIILKVRNTIANTGSTAGPATGDETTGRAYNEPEIALRILSGQLSEDDVEQWVRNADSSVLGFDLRYGVTGAN